MQEIYKEGELVGEPVLCPDNHYIRLEWSTRYDYQTNEPTKGVEVHKSLEPMMSGSGSWYTLEEVEMLGDQDLKRGLVIVGQAWYQTDWKDLHLIRPLNDVINSLGTSTSGAYSREPNID